jgi:type IV pilus assembly protein PilW
MTTKRSSSVARLAAQAGFTLVELLVGITLMGLVTLATVSLYSVAQQSYKTVDAGQELQDNARYAFDVIGQAIRNAGYQEYIPLSTDVVYSASVNQVNKLFNQGSVCPSGLADLPIIGYNNATIASTTSTCDFGTTDNATSATGNSDTLAIRFFGSSFPNASSATMADNTMVDCQGVAQAAPTGAATLGLSLFHVSLDTGTNEPSLSCITNTRNTQPIIRGVESFQVMYGLDTDGDGIPNRWVSAQNITTTALWLNVRAIRVGLVLRGPVGSSQGASTTASQNDIYPMGQDFTGTLSSEAGLKYTAPNDGRIRKVFTSVFTLRNSL